MQTILLDSNIYDKLWSDENTRLRLASLILHSKVRVIATPMIVDELTRSPFKGTRYLLDSGDPYILWSGMIRFL